MSASGQIQTTAAPLPLPPGAMIPTVYLPGSFADYLQLERAGATRHEFHGPNRIVAMAGGTPDHGRIGMNASRAVANRLDGTACEAFNGDTRVKVESIGKMYYPDVSAACGGSRFVEDRGTSSLVNPVLVIEVISPSTEQADRREKLNHYFMIESLREYVMVEQDEAGVTIIRRDADGSRRIDTVFGLDGVVPLASLGIELPMRDLYRNVVLPTSTTP